MFSRSLLLKHAPQIVMTRIYYHKIDVMVKFVNICKELPPVASSNDKQIRLFIKRQTNGKSNGNEWYNE